MGDAAAMQAAIEQLTAQMQTLNNQNQSLLNQVQHLQQQQAAAPPPPQEGLAAALAGLPTALAQVMASNRPRKLIDGRGIQKSPPIFSNKEGNFLHWSRKAEAYVTSVFEDAPDTLVWAAQQEDIVDYTKIDDDPEIVVSARG